ncbi:MAG TPA: DNA repair protein RadA [Firmicutes bacterium]|nr:DNA repair protein RadA [Bacillota bacterium]
MGKRLGRRLTLKSKPAWGRFVCQSCGYVSPAWFGRCPGCGEWNSILEEEPEPIKARGKTSHAPSQVQPVQIDSIDMTPQQRLDTGSAEFNRVLGGGVVPGSLVLLGGDPGIGKSTLLLQVCRHVAATGQKVLYVSGEESGSQIRIRADRLGALSPNILILSETEMEEIAVAIEKTQPSLCVVDSIQTVYSSKWESAAGSVQQIRQNTVQLMEIAKSGRIPIFIVGHVTKGGTLAGPMVLEHLVDVVLYFEGDRSQSFRIVRAVKNRFGSTNEIAVFEMSESGLTDVADPSQVLLEDRLQDTVGSVVCPCLEGNRALLVEVQALTVHSPFGTPRRTFVGLDYGRSALIVAIAEKHLGLKLATHDVFVKLTGGVSVEDPGADLAVAAAIVSSYYERPIPSDTVMFGELGLGGELRPVSGSTLRIKEAVRSGFRKCLLPRTNFEKVRLHLTAEELDRITLLPAKRAAEALQLLKQAPPKGD